MAVVRHLLRFTPLHFAVHSSTFMVLKYQQVTGLHFPLVAWFLLYGLFKLMSSPLTHTPLWLLL